MPNKEKQTDAELIKDGLQSIAEAIYDLSCSVQTVADEFRTYSDFIQYGDDLPTEEEIQLRDKQNKELEEEWAREEAKANA